MWLVDLGAPRIARTALISASPRRLEAGTFEFPFAETGRKEIAAWELAVLLEGIDWTKGRRRKRYALPAAMQAEENPAAAPET
jgi:hypothetical protein